MGFKKPNVAQNLWFYIYDEDIPPARVYSPSLKSPDNAPEGCSSLQAEIFYANGTEIPPAEKVLEETVSKLKAWDFSMTTILSSKTFVLNPMPISSLTIIFIVAEKLFWITWLKKYQVNRTFRQMGIFLDLSGFC